MDGQAGLHSFFMKKIFGFLAQKIGFACSISNSQSFVDGWFLGAGITVKKWAWETRPFGKYEWRYSLVIHTRKDFKFGFSYTEYDCRNGKVFSFWYGAIIISHY